MGNGHTPGPVDTSERPPRLDDGTSARIGSPHPGPVGLDARSGAHSPGTAVPVSAANMADQIVAYPTGQYGKRVGDGECFTLTDRALRAAGAKSAADYGRITRNGDYVWGRDVDLSDLKPGDVIQFRSYRYDREIVTQDGNRRTTNTDFQERPHHTAIVESVDGNGAVTVLEQNVPHHGPVRRNQLFFTAGTTTSGGATTTIRVQGTVWFYRPQLR
jgi:hypothetical protein